MVKEKNYDDVIDLKEYVDILKRRWKTIAGFAISFALAALIFSLLQKPVYEGKTTILIRSGSSSGPLSQFSGLAGIMGINMSSGKANVDDMTRLIQSNSVMEKVLDDLNLRDRIEGWNKPQVTKQSMINGLRGMLKKPKVDGNIVELAIQSSDAALSAEIANAFSDAFSFFWNELNYTEAKKKKEYIESQLPRVEKELKAAEERLKRFTLLSNKNSGTSINHDLLGGLSGSNSQGIDVARLSREYDIQNSVYTMLRKEYEQVKLEESKEIPPFSIVDRAVVPERKSKPKIRVNAMIGLMAGMFSGLFMAFFKEYWERSGDNV